MVRDRFKRLGGEEDVDMVGEVGDNTVGDPGDGVFQCEALFCERSIAGGARRVFLTWEIGSSLDMHGNPERPISPEASSSMPENR